MNSLVIYDSQYGNTAKIASSIAEVLKERGQVTLVKVDQVDPLALPKADLLLVGSPTQQFRATEAMRKFLDAIPQGALRGIRVSAFDTRLTEENIKSNRILAFFVGIYGYAAKRIASKLVQKGGELAGEPVGFFVMGMEGPLVDAEQERAATWARSLFA